MSHERMPKFERQLQAEIFDAQEDRQVGKGKRGDELQRRSSRLGWIRKAKAELEAEAAAGKARQRDQQAEEAAQDAKTAEASGDAQRRKRAARRSRGARKRAHDAQRLAIEKAEAAGLNLATRAVSAATAKADSLAMPQRTLPTDATGNPKPQAQRNVTDPDSQILKSADGWMQGYNAQAAVAGVH